MNYRKQNYNARTYKALHCKWYASACFLRLWAEFPEKLREKLMNAAQGLDWQYQFPRHQTAHPVFPWKTVLPESTPTQDVRNRSLEDQNLHKPQDQYGIDGYGHEIRTAAESENHERQMNLKESTPLTNLADSSGKKKDLAVAFQIPTAAPQSKQTWYQHVLESSAGAYTICLK